MVVGLRCEDGQAKTLDRLLLLLAPLVRLGGEAVGAPASESPPPPAQPFTPTGKIADFLPLHTHPLAPRRAAAEPADGPRVFAVPEDLRVGTTANKVRLEEMTAERAAGILSWRCAPWAAAWRRSSRPASWCGPGWKSTASSSCASVGASCCATAPI